VLEPAGIVDVVEGTEVPNRDATLDARFTRSRERLVRIAASLVGDGDAEDVVHDAYLLARRRYAQLRDETLVEPWLTRIVINLCYSRHRRRRILRDLLPRLLPSRAADRDIGLHELVEQLPPRERTVLILHYGHGYRLEEIAALFDLTHTNVRTIIARTRKRLYAAWRQAEEMDR
jgi:RNA polymerase sigma-70 factor, ECF subfamily